MADCVYENGFMDTEPIRHSDFYNNAALPRVEIRMDGGEGGISKTALLLIARSY